MNTSLLADLETRIHPFSGLANIPSQMYLPRSDIKLLSYNIFMRPPPVKNKADDFKTERLEDIVRELHNFDIVCFQESFGLASIRKKALISYAERLGFFFFYKSPEPSFFSPFLIDGGLLILSRFPIIKSDFENYRSRQDSDGLPMKGIAYTKLLIDNTKYLHLFTTHTQASYHGTGSKKKLVGVSSRLAKSIGYSNGAVQNCWEIYIEINTGLPTLRSDSVLRRYELRQSLGCAKR